MMKSTDILTLDLLNIEYLKWMYKYGVGRNENDLRFGQYLHFKYEVPMGIKGENEDGFYSETPINSYNQIIKKIT